MKEQDAQVDFQAQQHVYYVEKADHKFGSIVTGSFLSKNYLDDYWQKKAHFEQTLRHDLSESKISSIAYYMGLQDLSPADLAARAGISERKLRKHLTPEGFQHISTRQLMKYADVFNIPVPAFFQIDIIDVENKDAIRVEKEPSVNGTFIFNKIHLVK